MAVFKATGVQVYYNGVRIEDCDSAVTPSVSADIAPAQEWCVNVSGWIDKDSYFMRRLARRLAYWATQRAARWN